MSEARTVTDSEVDGSGENIEHRLHESEDRPDEASDIEDGEEPQARIELHPSDFYFGITLGEGAYARVVHAKSKKTDEQFAVKIMEKAHIKRENKVKQVMTERAILASINHCFLIKFFFSFQDPEYLYMCMEMAPGGELLSLITEKQNEKLDAGIEDEACDYATSQFYMAEVVEALEYLHGQGIIHRDLKPENVLISANGHVKVTDFGTSCRLDASGNDDADSPRNSFVGTQDYVSPEVLAGDRTATKACDLWALGCMIYQMLSGKSPFRAATEYLTFERIMGHCKGTAPLTYPPVINSAARSLIESLLQHDEMARIGAGEDLHGDGVTETSSGSDGGKIMNTDNNNTIDDNNNGSENSNSHTHRVGAATSADASAVDTDAHRGNGYRALKAHSFFSGIEWDKLADIEYGLYKPDPAGFPSAKNMRDGALDDWQFEGDPTPIISGHHHPHAAGGAGADGDEDEMMMLMNDSDYHMGGDVTAIGIGDSGSAASASGKGLGLEDGDVRDSHLDSDVVQVLRAAGVNCRRRNSGAARWKMYLQQNEKDVFSGLIYKRKGLFSKKRLLILTDTPRLFYLEPESLELKGEIPWTEEYPVFCHKKSSKEFDICCRVTGRNYHISDASNNDSVWVDVINAMVKRQRLLISQKTVNSNSHSSSSSSSSSSHNSANSGAAGGGSEIEEGKTEAEGETEPEPDLDVSSAPAPANGKEPTINPDKQQQERQQQLSAHKIQSDYIGDYHNSSSQSEATEVEVTAEKVDEIQ